MRWGRPETVEPDTVIRAKRAVLERLFRDEIGVPDPMGRVDAYLACNPAPLLIGRLVHRVPIAGRDLLDVGCGFGEFLVEAGRAGARVVGIDISADAVAIARDSLRVHGIRGRVVCAAGEALPFPDASFDVVVSNYVLEHVRSPERVLREIVRVLRPRGQAVLNLPNNVFPWEGHYNLVWPPMLPKVLGRWYVRLRGMNPEYLERLHYITRRRVLRTLEALPVRVVADLLLDCFETPGLVRQGWRRWAVRMIRSAHLHVVASRLAPDISLLIERTASQGHR